MLSSNNQENPVFQFLAGTFHQDIDSPEEALLELLQDESNEYLEEAIVFLTDFINSEYTIVEKNKFIEECAEGIYFPALGLEPLQWLKNVVQEIKQEID
ncbi:contact-dependent growth inhibition system immunity protein [Fictibacillus aquaticus]|uniref:CdiI immunity protein domain-containing protein n=1 Tax=Fictibacillus aquaticus TaxID=2021314 RepID=A0A235F7G5_9BACL|nr:contact-dependent growth inhibition system immunity protein [Fictibacillus aquaticus]OYD57172.1 hypothetical protein CGZ90_10790 [Fictibacillus aquaticus]